MASYSMHIKSAPPSAQKGAISIIEANNLEEATILFSQRKVLPRVEFDKIFTVKLIK
jgi:hypothetical protein